MKFVPLRNEGKVRSRQIFIDALEMHKQGITIALMRRRYPVLVKLEALKDEDVGIVLEDAEHETLSEALLLVAPTVAGRLAQGTLLAIVDEVRAAKSPAPDSAAGPGPHG